MTDAIETHRETALDSPYSRDRKDAIEQLVELYPNGDAEQRRRVLETLRRVAFEATSSQERELAREALVDALEADPETAAPVVVPSFCELASDGRHGDERLDAIGALGQFYSDVDETHREQIGHQLAEISGNATYEDERRLARQRLSDVTAENQRGTASGGADDESGNVGYLGRSLAEHLANAATESPEACIQRAEELQDFVAENPLEASAYEEVRDDLESLVEQLEVAPTDGGLSEERVERVERLATRVGQLYQRNGGGDS